MLINKPSKKKKKKKMDKGLKHLYPFWLVEEAQHVEDLLNHAPTLEREFMNLLHY